MGKIIALLSGGAGPWVLIGALVAALAAGSAGGYWARGLIDAPVLAAQQTATAQADTRTAQCVASHEKGRADLSEQALTALGATADAVRDAAAALAAKAGARDAANAKFLKDLANAPVSKTCMGSAAELAYRRSLQGPDAHAASTP